MKQKGHLPFFGIGPYYVSAIAMLTVFGMILSCNGYLDSGFVPVLKAPMQVLGILLIGLELLGSQDLLHLGIIGLAGLLHLLAHLLHTGSLLLGELRALAATLEIAASLEALATTTTHTTASGATHAATTHPVGILGVQLKQLLGLFCVETVFLDSIVGTTLDHLSLVKLGRASLVLTLIILCKGGSTHHHSGCQSYHHLFHCSFF